MPVTCAVVNPNAASLRPSEILNKLQENEWLDRAKYGEAVQESVIKALASRVME